MLDCHVKGASTPVFCQLHTCSRSTDQQLVLNQHDPVAWSVMRKNREQHVRNITRPSLQFSGWRASACQQGRGVCVCEEEGCSTRPRCRCWKLSLHLGIFTWHTSQQDKSSRYQFEHSLWHNLTNLQEGVWHLIKTATLNALILTVTKWCKGNRYILYAAACVLISIMKISGISFQTHSTIDTTTPEMLRQTPKKFGLRI